MGALTSCCAGSRGRSDDDQIRDPVTGLSEIDRSAIRSSWKQLVTDHDKMMDNGQNIFIILFRTYPYMRHYFKGIFPDSELRGTQTFRYHSLIVMYGINNLVSAMDCPDALVGLITRNAEIHYHRGIRIRQFQELDEVLKEYIRVTLRPTKEVEIAWDRLLTTHLAVIENALAGEEEKEAAMRLAQSSSKTALEAQDEPKIKSSKISPKN